MNIGATLQTSNLIHQSDSLPKLLNIFPVIFSAYVLSIYVLVCTICTYINF